MDRDGKKEKITILTENNQNRVTEFKKSFISYFSLGYDARVGFGIIYFNKVLKSQEQVIDVVIIVYFFGKTAKKVVVESLFL